MNNKKLPTREDVLYIMKHIDTMPFQDIRKNLKTNNRTLLNWCKMVFDNDQKEKRYRAIEHALDEMEMLESFDESLQSEYDIHSIRRIGLNNYWIVKRKIVNELRTCYMVTINHNRHFLVKFDAPVNRHSITYCPISLGCDYDVCSMSHWEFIQLERHLPVIEIEGDEQYAGKFWYALSNLAANEA